MFIQYFRFYDGLWGDWCGQTGQLLTEEDIRVLVERNREKEMDQKQVG